MALSKIKAPSIADDSITVDQIADNAVHGRRNLIINGAMQVAQRGTSFTSDGSNTSVYPVDRFVLFNTSGAGTATASQNSASPTEFTNSFKVDVTATDTSNTGQQELGLFHNIEAQNLQHLLYNTSSAKTLTLSFWVNSNKTGTYVVWFYTPDAGDHYSETYTINSVDTWEKKTITVPAKTSGGGINNDNGLGLQIGWILMAGDGFTSGTFPSDWETLTNTNRYVDQSVNLLDSADNNWYITGVQLEVGDTATPFEHRSYGEELALCERYFQIWGGKGSDFHALNMWNVNANDRSCVVEFPEMRASPSATRVGSPNNTSGGTVGTALWAMYYSGGWKGCSSLTIGTFGKSHARVDAQPNNSGGSGGASGLYGGTGCYFELSAEL